MLQLRRHKPETLTYEQANDLLYYKDGRLYWKKPGIKRVMNKEAGSVDRFGYIRVCINYRMYLTHRLVWLLHHQKWPDQFLDHINGKPWDNRIENLRDVSHSTNLRNHKNQRKPDELLERAT